MKANQYLSKSFVEKLLGQICILITIAIIGLFLIVPTLSVVSKGLIHDGGVSFTYFRLLFENDLMVRAITNSFLIALLTLLLSTVVSLPLALINTRYEFPLKPLISGLLLTPLILPPFVGAIGFQRFFALHGSVNLALMNLGVMSEPIDWIQDDTKLMAVCILSTFHLYPIMYLNLTAALANIDPSVEEMAKVIGVPKWKTLKDIVWPLAKPGFFAGATIVFIWALTDLGTPLLLGFQDTISVKIFNAVGDIHENPIGYCLVLFVLAVTLVLFFGSKYWLSRKRYDMLAKGHVTKISRPAKWWEVAAIYVFCSVIIGFSLLPHLGVLLTSISDKWFLTPLPEHYTLRYYHGIFHDELPLLGIKNSFLFAGASTLFDIILGTLIAYVTTRRLVRGSTFIDSIVMLPLALPGIVLAFGYIVTFSGTALDPMMNPAPLIVIAYGIRRLPYMVRSASAGLQQTSHYLEEASWTLGATKFYTLRKITLPLLLANLIAGALLCFSYAMLDVSDSLILAMKDRFYPMTKVIYVLFLEQGKGEFTASAMGMVAMAILAFCIIGASVILGRKMGELFKS